MTEPLRPLDFDDDAEIDPYMAHRQLREEVVAKIRNLSFAELSRLNNFLSTPGFLAEPAVPAEPAEIQPVDPTIIGSPSLADFVAALDRIQETAERRNVVEHPHNGPVGEWFNPNIGQPYDGDFEEIARRYGQQRSQFNPGSASVWFGPNIRPPENPPSLILPQHVTQSEGQSSLIRRFWSYALGSFNRLPAANSIGWAEHGTPVSTEVVQAGADAEWRADRARLAAQYQYASNPAARQFIEAAAAHEPIPADSRELQRQRERLMLQWWEAESDRLAAAANATTQEDARFMQAVEAAGAVAPPSAGGTLAWAQLPAENLPVDRTPRQPYLWSAADGAYIPMLGDHLIGDRVRGEIPEPQASMLGLDPDSFEPEPPSDEEAEAHAASLEAAAETTQPRRGWTRFDVRDQAGRIVVPETGLWNGPVSYRYDGIGYAVFDNRRALGANFD